jgi:hypothetical protein
MLPVVNDGNKKLLAYYLLDNISAMVTLSKEEVLKELKILGITSFSELKSYMSEYEQYIHSYDDQETSDNKDSFGKKSKNIHRS